MRACLEKLTPRLGGRGGREVDVEALALADEAEDGRRGLGRRGQLAQLDAPEGRAVDRLDHVAGLQAAGGRGALGPDVDDEQSALSPEWFGAGRREADGLPAEGLEPCRDGEVAEA